MIIGVPKEIKNREYRVAIVPGGVKVLTDAGHRVVVEQGAGLGAGITDDQFKSSGAVILPKAAEVWETSEMIMKVKEPIEEEFRYFRNDLILYTYLHLAAAQPLGHELVKKGVSAIAYETIQNQKGLLPLLTPMSEVAGRMSVQVGAQCLQKHRGGKGLLLGGVPGVQRGHVVIIGGGVVGVNAAKMAIGLGARVTILDIDAARLAYLDDIFGNSVDTLMSNPENIEKMVATADLVVGAVLVAGAKAPTLVPKALIETMAPGSVVVDVAIDQGGCIETIRPTTHDDPTFEVNGVVHYGVTNIPGDVPRTSTYALTNVTLPYALKMANFGLEQALRQDASLVPGLNTYGGAVVHKAVAEAMGVSLGDQPV